MSLSEKCHFVNNWGEIKDVPISEGKYLQYQYNLGKRWRGGGGGGGGSVIFPILESIYIHAK